MNENQLKVLEMITQAASQRAELAQKTMDLAMLDAKIMADFLAQSTAPIPVPQQASSVTVPQQASPVTVPQELAPMKLPTQITEPVLDTQAHAPFSPIPVVDAMPPGDTPYPEDNVFPLRLNINKPCDECPFASTCKAKGKIHLTDNCPSELITAKKLAATPGEFYMDIRVFKEGNRTRSTFIAYKDGVFIGNMFEERENKDARTILEAYPNQRVFMNSTPFKVREGVVFTTLYVEILRSEPLDMQPYEEPQVEEEIVLDFHYSL